MTGAAVVGPWLQSNKWTWLRLVLFVLTGLSAFAPIIHGATIFPYSQLDKQTGLRYYYLEGVLMLAGVALFVVSSERIETSEALCR
jgi:adiponectin receptor